MNGTTNWDTSPPLPMFFKQMHRGSEWNTSSKQTNSGCFFSFRGRRRTDGRFSCPSHFFCRECWLITFLHQHDWTFVVGNHERNVQEIPFPFLNLFTNLSKSGKSWTECPRDSFSVLKLLHNLSKSGKYHERNVQEIPFPFLNLFTNLSKSGKSWTECPRDSFSVLKSLHQPFEIWEISWTECPRDSFSVLKSLHQPFEIWEIMNGMSKRFLFRS